MNLANSINDRSYNFFGSIPFPNPVLKRLKITNCSVGNNLMCLKDGTTAYSPASGRQALPWSYIGITNTSASTITTYCALKTGGVVYPVGASRTITTATPWGTTNGASPVPILKSGENYVINCDVAGLNAFMNVLEIDDTLITRALITSLSNGNNTLYTCPEGKTAALLSLCNYKSFDGSGQLSGFGRYVSTYVPASVGATALKYYIVPNGFGINPASLVDDSNTTTGQCPTTYMTSTVLYVYDSIVISSNNSNAGIVSFASILEVPIPV